MPSGSLDDARKSEVTRKFEVVYEICRESNEHIEAWREAGHLNSLCGYCREILIRSGFTDEDIAHVEASPPALREQVRSAMIHARDAGVPCLFGWSLTDAPEEAVKVNRGPTAVAVVFEIPRVREPVPA